MLRNLRDMVGYNSKLQLPEHGHSALLLAQKVLPGIFCYKLGVIYGLAFPDVTDLRAHMSKADTIMLRWICEEMAALDSRVGESQTQSAC